MSGPVAVLLNSSIYMAQYRIEMAANKNVLANNQTVTFVHSAYHHHHNHEHPSVLNKLIVLVLINIDPLLSILLAIVYVLFFSKIFKLSALILAQSVPMFIDLDKIQQELKEMVTSL